MPVLRRGAFAKQITAAGFQLKGSGWYATDFRGGANAPAATPADKGAEAGKGADAGKTDSAPRPPSPTRPALRPAAAARPAPATEIPMHALRKWLLAGLLVIVPVAITVSVLRWIIDTLDQTLLILPQSWHPDRLFGHIPGFGVLLTLAILLIVGATASNFLGKKLMHLGDRIVARIPVVRSIYSSVKQVSDTLFSESGNAFRKAVLVQWPRADVWTIAFVTGTPGGDVTTYLRGEEYVSVYVPTTPNPTGGYFVMLRKSDCIELKMSVDDALKVRRLHGVVSPDRPEDDRARLSARESQGHFHATNAYDLLRSRDRSPHGPDREPVRLGEPPP